MPLVFAPAEAYHFDWSHECDVIDGVTIMAKIAHMRLCHSRMPFLRAYPRESQEMVFDAHEKAFAFSLILLVPPPRIERGTPRSTIWCSNQ